MHSLRLGMIPVAGFLAGIALGAEPRTGYFETAFDIIPSYARADVLAQRTLSPNAVREIKADTLAYSIDPREENWQVYVPPHCASGSCGLLVWIYASDAPPMDRDWQAVFDKENVIFVAALHSGNEHDPFERRLPLALTGLGAIASNYPVDASRVFVGGFSGGAKIAEVLAFGYPDVFHGVILNAGFLDPAAGVLSYPPAPLDEHLQKLPFVFVVGRRDRLAWKDFLDTLDSFQARKFKVTQLTDPRQRHTPMTASQLRTALEVLNGT